MIKLTINIIMQSAFFKLTNILDYNRAKQEMANYVIKSYSKFGQTIVDANIKAIEYGDKITELPIDNIVAKGINNKMNDINSEFYHNIMLPIEKLNGQNIPVSSFSVDGSIPVGTSQYEKRGIATDLPVWDRSKCIQCNLCSTVCPHASIRTKETTNPLNAEAVDTLTKNGNKFCLSVSPLDCTGCGNCVDICPARQKALSMQRSEDVLDSLLDNCEQFNKVEGIKVNDTNSIKNSQFKQPLLEFSGACAGCGQTAYVKLLTQLCGENLIIANATGCSSIWGGSYPSCPYTKTQDGLGVAWANSLFEDNAEFGLGIRLATELRRQKLMNVWAKISENNENLDKLYKKWLQNLDNFEVCKEIYFELLDALKHKNKCKNTKQLISLLDVVMPKNVWIIGGDGWAYDIGYGGLDHILASGQNVNILVLDTEIYSNTGGQASKSTPIGAVAKFAQSGKQTKKKDLAKMAMQYDDVYVARICIGANPNQALTAFKEAMENKGPSIIIAYAPCVSQGIDMSKTPTIEKMAVQSGYFTLLRRKPKITKSALEIAEENIKNNKQNENVEKNPTNVNETNTLDDYNKISGELIIDSGKPIISLEDFISIQNRFKIKK